MAGRALNVRRPIYTDDPANPHPLGAAHRLATRMNLRQANAVPRLAAWRAYGRRYRPVQYADEQYPHIRTQVPIIFGQSAADRRQVMYESRRYANEVAADRYAQDPHPQKRFRSSFGRRLKNWVRSNTQEQRVQRLREMREKRYRVHRMLKKGY